MSNSYTIYKKRLFFDNKFNDSVDNYSDVINNNNITGIVFSNYSNEHLKLMYTKNNLWMLKHSRKYVGSKFNTKTDWSVLPEKITYLSLGDNYNQISKLPNNLIYLLFGFAFDCPVELPNKLIYLVFGQQFNHPIKWFPNTLKYLVFGKFFNQQVILPEGLEHLELGLFFDQPINLPDGLKNLVFEENVKEITIPKNINQLVCCVSEISNKLQLIEQISCLKKIKKLEIHGMSFPENTIKILIPPNLIDLSCYCKNKIFFDNYNNLSKITLGGIAGHDIEFIDNNINSITLLGDNKVIDNLPHGITTVILGGNFHLSVDNLPNGIKNIIFQDYYYWKDMVYSNQLNNLPETVEYIKLSSGYNKKIIKFPKNLKKIVCSKNYEYIADFNNYVVWTY